MEYEFNNPKFTMTFEIQVENLFQNMQLWRQEGENNIYLPLV